MDFKSERSFLFLSHDVAPQFNTELFTLGNLRDLTYLTLWLYQIMFSSFIHWSTDI